MENNNKEDLLMELAVIETMVKENPCGLKDGLFSVTLGHYRTGRINTMIFQNARRTLHTIRHIIGWILLNGN